LERRLPAFVQDLPNYDVLDALYWFVPLDVEYGTVLLQPGDEEASLVVVGEGELVVQRDGLDVACVAQDGIVGEIELFGGRPRASTVKAIRPTSIFVLEREGYEALREANNPVVWALERAVVAQVDPRVRLVCERLDVLADAGFGTEAELPEPGWVERVGRWLRRGVGNGATVDPAEAMKELASFAGNPAEALAELAESFRSTAWRAGRVLARQGQPGGSAWIVVEGEVAAIRECASGPSRVTGFGPGAVLGATASLGLGPQPFALVTSEECVLLEISGAELARLYTSDGLVGSCLRTAMIRSLGEQLEALDTALLERDSARRRAIAESLAPLRATGTIAG
jgi:CRP-like cAMP-binding protein